ncbi:uncharacterized protein LOC141617897 [Silene latifolia]|uniref:uncharacterized protein LOC141617897 n=1 Tax=Silene latifolia TaxID=37657 RepID=UPI003D7822AC
MVRPNLTNDQRHRIGCYLIENSINCKPVRGQMKVVAAKFNVDRKTIYEIWKVAKYQRLNGEELQLNSKMKGKKGRTPIELPVAAILAIPKGERGTMDALSKAIKVSVGTICTWVKLGKLRSHTNAIKPALTEENKFHRLNFVLTKLWWNRITGTLQFKDMCNVIHIDEKWFYITQNNAKIYLLSEEVDPYRSCQSKNFITKVMFMAAVSRPIYDDDNNLIFDGKIGIFPFTFQEPAKRRSKNRAAGTLETKSIASINKQVIKEMLIEKILPAITSKWPALLSKNIIIQQDNARPHLKSNDPDFLNAAQATGYNISLTQQPPNSPDLNILDLGFFRSIQSLQSQKRAKTVDELVFNVMQAWDEEPALCLSDVWLSLQSGMLEIMKTKGHNDFKVPHLHTTESSSTTTN